MALKDFPHDVKAAYLLKATVVLYMACHSIIGMFKALLYVLILRLHGPTQTQSSHSNKNEDALVSELVVNLIPAPHKV